MRMKAEMMGGQVGTCYGLHGFVGVRTVLANWKHIVRSQLQGLCKSSCEDIKFFQPAVGSCASQ